MNHSKPTSEPSAESANPNASRRQFLAASAGVAGVALTNAKTLAATDASRGFGDREIRIGVIGFGGRGSGAVRDLMRAPGKVKLVAIGDAFEHRIQGSLAQIERVAKQEAEKKGLQPADLLDVPPERRFTGLDAYQKVLATDCDLVVLATPPGFRPEHFEAAVDAGKHVFMEKPVATDVPGVQRVLAAGKRAAEKGLGVQVGLQRRHEEKYQAVISRLQEGAIGDIVMTRVYWNSNGVWVRPRESHQNELQYQVNNWYYFNWLSGDHILEQHIHNLDVSNWLMQGTPVEAQGQGGRLVRTGKQFGQIFDHHMVEYTYANGAKMISQCRHQEGCWESVGEHAHGTQGRADISGGKIYNADGKLIYRHKKKLGASSGQVVEQRDFITALRAGEVPNEAEYGALSTMTAILGRMATYSGQVIKWDEAIASKQTLVPAGLTSWDAKPPIEPDEEGRYPIPVPGKTVVL